MRKLTLFISAILITAGFSNCNQSSDKSDKPTTDSTKAVKPVADKIVADGSCDGVVNLQVTQEEAERMTKEYNDKYILSSAATRRLSKDVWVDAGIFTAIDDLLQKSGKFDGVRFVNSSESGAAMTTVTMVPTVTRDPHIDGLSDHVNSWAKILTAPGHDPVFPGINRDSAATKLMEDRFEGLYTGNFHDNLCLSKTVWMGTCVIHALRQLIEAPNSQVDGVRVLFGAYPEENKKGAPGQIAANQSTIILVPTIPATDVAKFPDGHASDWTLIPERVEFTNMPKGGYNHGELCPNSCGIDGSKKHK